MLRNAALGLGLLASAMAPLAAQGDVSDEALLQRRLRACLTAGAPGAPRDSLASAVAALRSLCYTQFRRLRELRLREVDAPFGLPNKTLSRDEQEQLGHARDRATRQLDGEIALAISNFTGLTQ